MSASKFAAIAFAGIALAACAGSPDGMGPGPRENTGTLLGAGTGAVLGAAVAGGGTGNRLAGAAIGGAVGGLIGNRIGSALDDEDKQRAYAAQMDALERGQSGAPVSWRNPDSGRYGTVVPGPAYQQAGRKCRCLYPHRLYRRPATDRPRHCLPQSGRHLDGDRLNVRHTLNKALTPPTVSSQKV